MDAATGLLFACITVVCIAAGAVLWKYASVRNTEGYDRLFETRMLMNYAMTAGVVAAATTMCLVVASVWVVDSKVPDDVATKGYTDARLSDISNALNNTIVAMDTRLQHEIDTVDLATLSTLLQASNRTGLMCWDINENGACDHILEDTNQDGNCTALDCQGEAGPFGVNGTHGIHCWDKDADHVCDLLTEDINNDGMCNHVDCQGPAGVNGTSGHNLSLIHI